ncbi:MAG: AI-2E family transporter [Myxococcaceae bacterium]
MTSSNRARWSNVTFVIGLVATLAVVAWIGLEYFVPLLLALCAAVLAGRWNEKLVRRLGGRRRLAALLMTVGVVLVLLLPLAYMTVRLVLAAVPLIEQVARTIGRGELDEAVLRALPPSVVRALQSLELGSFQTQLEQRLVSLTSALAGFAASIPTTAAGLLVDGFVTLVALYTFFLNGPRLVRIVVEATPMERQYTRDLLDAIAAAIRSVFGASLITALIQFALGYLGFLIVGTPYALGLAGMMAFLSFVFSLVPVLGSGLVWVPVGVGLLIGGRPVAGLFILGWGVFVLGSVDNVVKPLWARDRLRLPIVLVFVTLFGGLSVFGPIGALLGPLFGALAAAFLHIWTTDFLTDAEPVPPLPPPPAGRIRRLLRRPPREPPPARPPGQA